MKNPKLLLAIILFTIAATTLIPHAYSSTLTITVSTDKPHYLIQETITVHGNLTHNSSPVQDWPVALEVQDPNNTPVVTRTLQTDTNGTYDLPFKLPTNSKLGTYTVHVSSSYKGETATNNTTFELVPLQDITVTNITLSKTIVGQGYPMNITITVENQGDLTETFNVTVHYNETAITLPDGKNHTTTTLTSGSSATVTFPWNTTGVTKGNYTITAKATPLPYETDTTDNTLTDGTVHVTIPGDVNGNRHVFLYDAVMVGATYGAKKGDSRYDANCDINDNGHVFLYDAVIVGAHYGQKDC